MYICRNGLIGNRLAVLVSCLLPLADYMKCVLHEVCMMSRINWMFSCVLPSFKWRSVYVEDKDEEHG